MSYLYVKKDSPSSHLKSKVPRLSSRTKKYFAGAFFVFGFLIFASAILPIVEYQLEYSVKFGQIVNPLSSTFYNRGGNILGQLTTDYTQLNNWFVSDSRLPDSPNVPFSPSGASTYSLTIPRLGIHDALIIIGGQDLKKSLIQYPQTALPGQFGNGVVFGHSVLPQFFNSKSYLTIFATLYRLKQGDEILVKYDNIEYKYLVEEMFEVQPTDLSILEQRYDGRYLSLVTCSPPGTYLRRLVVKSRVVDI